MEKSSPNTTNYPLLCIQGCGFFGNPVFGNMCSKCFKDAESLKKKVDEDASAPEPQESSSTTTTELKTEVAPLTLDPTTDASAVVTALVEPSPKVGSLQESPSEEQGPSSEASGTATPSKVEQSNKSRCFKCRTKVSMAKQIANKCRCDYVFCDAHRTPALHDCDFDYKDMNKVLLEKNNPTVSKKGGSFQRIE